MKQAIITCNLFVLIFLSACSTDSPPELLGVWETKMVSRKGGYVLLNFEDSVAIVTDTTIAKQWVPFNYQLGKDSLVFEIPAYNASFAGTGNSYEYKGMWTQSGIQRELIFIVGVGCRPGISKPMLYKSSTPLPHPLHQDWHVLLEIEQGLFKGLKTNTYLVGQAEVGDPAMKVAFHNNELNIEETTGSYQLKLTDNKRELVGIYINNQKDTTEITFKKTAKSVADFYVPSPKESYQYEKPSSETVFSVASLAEVGMNEEKIEAVINKIYSKEYAGVHSMLIYKNQKLVLEEYFYDHHKDYPHEIRSISKSLASICVGIAIDKGFIHSADDKVLDYLPHYKSIATAGVEHISFKDFLTMSSGLDCDDLNRESAGNQFKMSDHADWVKFVMSLPVKHETGEKAAYCSGGVGVIMEALTNAANLKRGEFVKEHLFKPLEIEDYYSSLTPTGQPAFYWMTSRDLMKIGAMTLNSGRWNNTQIVSSDWLQEATQVHAQLNIGKFNSFDYGYFFWIDRFGSDGETRGFHAGGSGGQAIFVVPQHELVVVFTAGNYGAGKLNNLTYQILKKDVIGALE